MMKNIFLFIFISLFCTSNAQRISSGLNFHVPFAGMVHFKQNFYTPQNNFRVYFVNATDAEKEKFTRISLFGFGKWYKSIGFGAGYTAKIDFKRFALRMGYQFTFMNTNIKLNQLDNGGGYGALEIDEYPAEFVLQSFHHSFPATFSIDLKKKNNSPFVFFGAEYNYIFSRMESIDWDFNVFYDRYAIPFLYGHYYDNSGSVSALIGMGLKKKRFEWMVNYKFRVDENKNNLTMTHSLMEFNMNFYLTYKTFKRKHRLFIDE